MRLALVAPPIHSHAEDWPSSQITQGVCRCLRGHADTHMQKPDSLCSRGTFQGVEGGERATTSHPSPSNVPMCDSDTRPSAYSGPLRCRTLVPIVDPGVDIRLTRITEWRVGAKTFLNARRCSMVADSHGCAWTAPSPSHDIRSRTSPAGECHRRAHLRRQRCRC